MRHAAVAITLGALCAAPTAQTLDLGNILQRGVNEVLRSMNTPATPAPSSSRPIYIPSAPPVRPPTAPAPAPASVSSSSPSWPQVSDNRSAPEQNVDARIADMLGNPAEFRAFFNQLKQATAASDMQTLAKMMNYPLSVSGGAIKVFTEKDFTDNYNRIFTPPVIAAVKAQSYADLFVRDQGASVGSGILWFSGVCTDNTCNRRIPKVVTVNTPPAAADTTAPGSVPASPAQPAGEHVIAGLSLPTDPIPGRFGSCRNIPITSGPSLLTITGVTDPDRTDCYRLTGRNGQTVHIKVVSVTTGISIDGLAEHRHEVEFTTKNQTYDIMLVDPFPGPMADHYELLVSFK